jgi:hypothetical protein
MTTPPMNFGVEGDTTAAMYGRYSWSVGLSDGREVHVMLDEIEVLDSGALRCAGALREHPGDPVPTYDPETTLLLAAGAWTHAYAASLIDGSPIAVGHLDKPE